MAPENASRVSLGDGLPGSPRGIGNVRENGAREEWRGNQNQISPPIPPAGAQRTRPESYGLPSGDTLMSIVFPGSLVIESGKRWPFPWRYFSSSEFRSADSTSATMILKMFSEVPSSAPFYSPRASSRNEAAAVAGGDGASLLFFFFPQR